MTHVESGSEERVREYLEGHRQDLIRGLADLIEIPSVSEELEQVRKSLDHVLVLAGSLGFRAEKLLEGQIGLVEMGEGPETMGILVHVDVVPPGELGAWENDPFQPVIKDGKIFGRGAVDDKGPLIAALYAMKAVLECGAPLCKKVQLIIGTQEEVTWTDLEAYVSRYPLPDYGFTPDGNFPVCNIEKGYGTFQLAFPFNQPEKGLLSIDGGKAINMIPGRCRAVLRTDQGLEERVVYGVEAHSCQPENGENAILALCRELVELDLPEDPIKEICGHVLRCFSDRECAGIGLRTDSEYFNGEFIHRNILSPTIIRTVGNEVQLVVNMRYVYGMSLEEIERAFQAVGKKVGCDVTLLESMPPVYISRERPFIQAFSEAYRKISGHEEQYALEYGGSYAKAMPNIVNWGPLFPGDVDTCHKANEFITLENLLLNSRIFAEAIRSIACSDKSFK